MPVLTPPLSQMPATSVADAPLDQAWPVVAAIDFWRVVAVEPGRRLTLLAEMKVPGSAMLEFELQPQGEQRTHMQVTAYFHPAGAPGLLYWYDARTGTRGDLQQPRQGNRAARRAGGSEAQQSGVRQASNA